MHSLRHYAEMIANSELPVVIDTRMAVPTPIQVSDSIAIARRQYLTPPSSSDSLNAYREAIASDSAPTDPRTLMFDSLIAHLPLPSGDQATVILRSPYHPWSSEPPLVLADAHKRLHIRDSQTHDGWTLYLPPNTQSWPLAAYAANALSFPLPAASRLLGHVTEKLPALRLLVPGGTTAWLRVLADRVTQVPTRLYVAPACFDDERAKLNADPSLPPWELHRLTDIYDAERHSGLTIISGLVSQRPVLNPTRRHGTPATPSWCTVDSAPEATIVAPLAAKRDIDAEIGLISTLPSQAHALLSHLLNTSQQIYLADPHVDTPALRAHLHPSEPPTLVDTFLSRPPWEDYEPLKEYLTVHGLLPALRPLSAILAAQQPTALSPGSHPAQSLSAGLMHQLLAKAGIASTHLNLAVKPSLSDSAPPLQLLREGNALSVLLSRASVLAILGTEPLSEEFAPLIETLHPSKSYRRSAAPLSLAAEPRRPYGKARPDSTDPDQ